MTMDLKKKGGKIDPVVSYYDRNAQRLARSYESLIFEIIHQDLLPFLPKLPARVLDVGAGSGRDAGALAARGYDVIAIEPSRELMALGAELHVSPRLTWCADSLPSLNTLSGCAPFDLILCSAVWMHLSRKEQTVAMRRLAFLCADGARICITYRTGMSGEDALVFGVSVNEIIADASANRLQLLKQTVSPDWNARTGVNWVSFVFEKSR